VQQLLTRKTNSKNKNYSITKETYNSTHSHPSFRSSIKIHD